MSDFEFYFEKLEIWKKSRSLVVDVYKILKFFPREEHYALCDQIRRAVISVPSNIAEGSSRSSVKEKIHFLEIALGSLYEVYCQLTSATDLQYIPEEQFKSIKPKFHDLARMLIYAKKALQEKQ